MLRESIENILSQTYKIMNLLLLMIQSDDETTDVIESYNDEQIKNDRNMGITKILSRGMDIAIRKYIAGMDSKCSNMSTTK